MPSSLSQVPIQPQKSQADDEIDLRQVGAALNRQKLIVGGIVSIAVLVSATYAFTRKPV